VVRHHAGRDFDSGLSFIPVVDVSTHTFGARVEVRPGQLDLAKVARLMNRISRSRLRTRRDTWAHLKKGLSFLNVTRRFGERTRSGASMGG
jgi:hypothetical protein